MGHFFFPLQKIHLYCVFMNFLILCFLILSYPAFATRTIVKCLEGEKSMTIMKARNGILSGHFIGFEKELKQMSCNRIKDTQNYRCNKGEYNVFAVYQENKLSVELSTKNRMPKVKDDRHRLNCKN